MIQKVGTLIKMNIVPHISYLTCYLLQNVLLLETRFPYIYVLVQYPCFIIQVQYGVPHNQFLFFKHPFSHIDLKKLDKNSVSTWNWRFILVFNYFSWICSYGSKGKSLVWIVFFSIYLYCMMILLIMSKILVTWTGFVDGTVH